MSKTGGALLRVAVGDKPEWRSPDHALRKDSRTKLRVIPTLIHWTEGGPGARLGGYLVWPPCARVVTTTCCLLPSSATFPLNSHLAESELESAPTEAEAEKVTLAFIEQCRS